MKPYGISDRLKASEWDDCFKTPIRKKLTNGRGKRKDKLSKLDLRAYKSFKSSTRQTNKKITKEEYNLFL